MMCIRLLFYFVIVTSAMTAIVADDNQPFVTTPTGKIFGKRIEVHPHQLPDIRRTAAVYSRIPYVEPPVGNLRYRPPVSKVLHGDFDATRSGVACPQPAMTAFNILGGLERSEDCLYLDVIVPEPKPSNAAVMVYIHGGGYFVGLGSAPDLMPVPLAVVGDVILVTFNYRLGALGFLATGDDEIPANLGMLDQRQAMLWVRENIAAFGGDPDRITIFGVSAGGSSVNLQLLSPLSSGLFTGAIMQSGTLNNAFSHYSRMEDAVKVTFDFGRHMGCDVSSSNSMATCLREKSAEDILETIQDSTKGSESGNLFSFRPVADGHFIPDDPYKLAASGSFNPAVVMNGCLSHEGDLMIELLSSGEITSIPSYDKTRFRDFISATLQTDDPVIVDSTAFVYADTSQFYDSEADYVDSVSRLVGDTMFVCPANTMTRNLVTAGNTVYSYLMTHVSSESPYGNNFTWFRATHGDDLPYVFGSPLKLQEGESNLMGSGHFSQDEVEISLQIMRYWTNFAKTGDPNLSSNEKYDVTSDKYPHWPKSTVQEMMYKELSLTFPNHAGTPKTRECFYWESLFPTLVQNSIEKIRLNSVLEEKVENDSQKSCTDEESCP